MLTVTDGWTELLKAILVIPELLLFLLKWSAGPSCHPGIMIDLAEKQRVFPSPQRSEQPRVFVFPGRAPSSVLGIVHVLHGNCLLTQ